MASSKPDGNEADEEAEVEYDDITNDAVTVGEEDEDVSPAVPQWFASKSNFFPHFRTTDRSRA